MIARTWRGVTRSEDRDAYLEYLRRTGLADYASTEGNRGALILSRTAQDRTEFLLLSLWESEDAIRAFAGDRPERAVFYPEDDRYLVEKDAGVDHYEVVESGLERGEDLHARGWRIAGFR